MTQKIKLSAPRSGGATIVPNCFIDVYMPEANNCYVKIYLYLLRRVQAGITDFSVNDIADSFCLTEGDVLRAFHYWENKGLFTLQTDASGAIISISLNMPEETGELQAAAASRPKKAGPVQTPAARRENADNGTAVFDINGNLRTDITGSATADADNKKARMEFQNSDKGREIFLVTEQYLGRPLSPSDMEKISFFHETLGFSCDLIDYLFDYCVSNDKRDMRYIEKVALGWAQENIHTVEEARRETEIHQASGYAVMTELGLGNRRPAPGEMEFIRKWLGSYGFSLEMVLEACRRTMMTIHSPSFEYTDKILQTWKDEGITTREEVLASDKEREKQIAQRRKSRETAGSGRRNSYGRSPSNGNRFNNFTQRDYDYDKLEQQLLQKSRKDTHSEGSGS